MDNDEKMKMAEQAKDPKWVRPPEELAKAAGWMPNSDGSRWSNPNKPGKDHANAQEVVEAEGLK